MQRMLAKYPRLDASDASAFRFDVAAPVSTSVSPVHRERSAWKSASAPMNIVEPCFAKICFQRVTTLGGTLRATRSPRFDGDASAGKSRGTSSSTTPSSSDVQYESWEATVGDLASRKRRCHAAQLTYVSRRSSSLSRSSAATPSRTARP